jgi:quercetin dioxygenase-like cupin family protein
MKSLMAVVVAAAFAAPLALARPQDVTCVLAKDVKWTPAKGMPEGVMSCVVNGDPAKGPVLVLTKVPAGTLIAAHTHSSDEFSTIISGGILLGRGETVDEAKGTLLEAGSYVQIPAKMAHWAKAKAETVFLRFSPGPLDITFCEKK